jgi:hypothetical protein
MLSLYRVTDTSISLEDHDVELVLLSFFESDRTDTRTTPAIPSLHPLGVRFPLCRARNPRAIPESALFL